MDRRKIP